MHFVRRAGEDDLATVFEFCHRLNLHHIGMEQYWLLSEDQLRRDLFRDYVCEALLLIDAQTGLAKGLLLYTEKVRLSLPERNSNKGIYLEVFYLTPDLRGRGLGAVLMRAMCEEALGRGYEFIKIIFQTGLDLQKMYTRMGFVNTTVSRGTQLFDVYGPEELADLLLLWDRTTALSEQFQITYIGLPVPEIDADGMQSHYRVVLVADQSKGKSCVFTQQISYCSWLGRMLLVGDFTGDTSIFNGYLIRYLLCDYIASYPEIAGVWIEINDGLTTDLSGVLTDELGFENITETEGWNVSYLFKDEMLALLTKMA